MEETSRTRNDNELDEFDRAAVGPGLHRAALMLPNGASWGAADLEDESYGLRVVRWMLELLLSVPAFLRQYQVIRLQPYMYTDLLLRFDGTQSESKKRNRRNCPNLRAWPLAKYPRCDLAGSASCLCVTIPVHLNGRYRLVA